MSRIIGFSAVVELGTGIALVAEPAIVVRLLLGTELPGAGLVAGRCFGVALLALALACWPTRGGAKSGKAPFRAMLVYNALIALYLAGLGTAGPMRGSLLWPAVILHAAVAIALLWSRSSAHVPEASSVPLTKETTR